MRPEIRPDIRYVVRPVAAVVMLVLAVLVGFTALVNGPDSTAHAVTDEPTSPDPSDPPSSETPTDDPSSDEPSDEPTEDPTEQPTQEPTQEPTQPPSTEEPDEIEVDNAVFRWGINNQVNAHSHNPQAEAINFMSAGVADPGGANRFLPKRKWRAREGAVSIQKLVGSRQRLATWAGLRTAADGKTRINSSSVFSGHTVVMRKGVGTVDAGAGEATISWRGTFTVLFYGGNTMLTVSDPTLEVADGVGRVSAVLGGFASARNGGGWKKVTPRRVRIADLPQLELGKEGLSASPAYAGVKVSGSTEQDTTGTYAGAFPQPMIGFLKAMGTDQFWYSTGLSTDQTKVASDLFVSYDEANEVTPTPTSEPTPTEQPSIDNPVNDPPPQAVQQTVPQPRDEPAPSPASQAPGLPDEIPEAQRALLTPADLGQVRNASASSSNRTSGLDDASTWWLGGALLLLVAAGLLLVPARPRP